MITLTNEMILNDIRNEIVSNFSTSVLSWFVIIIIAIIAAVFIIIGIYSTIKKTNNIVINEPNSNYNSKYTHMSNNKNTVRNVILRNYSFYLYNKFSIGY